MSGWLLVVAALGCHQEELPPPQRDGARAEQRGAERSAEPGSSPSGPSALDWSAYKGRCVQMTGYAAGMKIGELLGGPYPIGAVFDDKTQQARWQKVFGQRIIAQGKVAERGDLPVFVEKEGELPIQGMPVPEGTDLEAARRRLVLEVASFEVVRSTSKVEAELSERAGGEVALPGVTWSSNGRWWFEHDGVPVHVAGHREAVGWSDMHGRAVTLHGDLSAVRLPPADGRASTPVDTFRLEVSRVAAHPDWRPEPCVAKRP